MEKAQAWFQLVQLSDSELLKLCTRDFFKGTGAGGQKKNKTASGVRLTLDGLQVYESQARSKDDNQKKSLKKLRLALASQFLEGDKVISEKLRELHPAPETLILPYVQSSFLRINEKNSDFPLVIGGIFDLIAGAEGDLEKVSEILSVSKSQIHKFFDKHPSLKESFGKLKKYCYNQYNHE
ncbi:MAG: peptide chain release factor-like protein [SAR324 cluster bacterium]|nr:peptide chain release factor-like protein [SAR324 cluster bacterium]